ncbi:substrate-binding periplasmic protein [Colwellia hornerae]|uniref:Transporter substrate-binding domain-containing protein n=1 Tax=Colwellia hornerae TaxID=89402 RepID=A0A5C6QQP5_9GAMM|nr:transporter substrate-binding domain-containing protein [Colwellia hornerae]TWX57726.1 transporter substrate-binding domain-containing protein [Colwellia hornerae]TWX62543.1 transporter substrate-binding domain-containing protein [Colwellia hornerae]TWX71455.1 transporter substrate-binding domain-containing protein [Colwellia hornerae]
MKELKEKLAIGFGLFLVLFADHVSATKLSILTEHLAPYQIVASNTVTGLSTEIIEATLTQAQYAYDISAHPWTLSYRRAQHGKNTCIYSLARIPQRESLFKWVGHIASSTISLYSLKNSQIVISTIEEAKKYNIAVIRDDVTHHFLLTKNFVENQNLYVVENYDALLKLLDLSSRRIDLVVLNDDLLKNRVKDLGEVSRYRNVFQFNELTLNFHFACSLNTEQIIVDNLTKAMKLLEQRGVFLAIREQWKKNMVSLIN